MNETVALVTAVAARRVELEARVPACTRCLSGRGCGAGLLAGGSRTRRLSAELPTGVDVRPGDTVVLSFHGPDVLRGVLYAYGLPLTGLLSGAIAAAAADASTATAVAFAAVGIAVGMAGGRLLADRQACRDALQPRVLCRAGAPDPGAAAR